MNEAMYIIDFMKIFYSCVVLCCVVCVCVYDYCILMLSLSLSLSHTAAHGEPVRGVRPDPRHLRAAAGQGPVRIEWIR